MTAGKVLIIDDEDEFLDIYERKLGRQGYLVETAKDRRTALEKLEGPGWDAVLLDQRLQGSYGPDSGLDLIPEIVRHAPRARILLVTAYATDKAVTQAFDAGAHDYLQKDELFDALLVPKLRNAVETARALRLASMTTDETEAEIRQTWAAARTEPDPNRKGKLLEDLLVLLLTTIPGFQSASPRRRNEIEEIDVLVRNESPDPTWAKEGSYLLVEYKNWSKPADTGELVRFIEKVRGRYGRCRLGLFVSTGGFTAAFKEKLRAKQDGDVLVLLLDAEGLTQLVEAADRNAFLKKLHTDALVAQNGHAHPT
jgi:ActR/RegA family two-component response regulator